MDNKKSFILYTEYEEPISELSDEEAGKLFKALFSYARGDEINLTGAARMAFMFIKTDMDINSQKYAEKVEKRREAGKRGGRPRENEAAEAFCEKQAEEEKTSAFDEKQADEEKANAIDEKQAKAKKANAFIKKQVKTKKADNVNDNDNDNVNDNDNIIYFCPEQRAPDGGPPDCPVVTLPLNNGSEYGIFNTDIVEWEGLYPSVDVIGELKKMRGWLSSNPKRRKTKTGILRFVNGWLAREQDSYKPPDARSENQNPFLTMLENERSVGE